MGIYLQKSANDKLHKTSGTGKLQLGTDLGVPPIPPGEGAEDCFYCAGNPAPYFLKVTFSGVTLCEECCLSQTFFQRRLEWVNNINRIHYVPQSDVNSCMWVDFLVSGIAIQEYEPYTGNCAAPTVAYTRDLRLVIIKTSSTRMDVQFFDPLNSPRGWVFLQSAVTVTSKCIEVSNIPNAHTRCGYPDYPPDCGKTLAYGGTVTVEEV